MGASGIRTLVLPHLWRMLYNDSATKLAYKTYGLFHLYRSKTINYKLRHYPQLSYMETSSNDTSM
jgi:muconolactone delta-isomerase